jgi:hypothetical protein
MTCDGSNGKGRQILPPLAVDIPAFLFGCSFSSELWRF